eukprot:SAG31_NODE_3230_length_4516_cov_3.158252_3_plen_112_part_00
MAAPRTETLDDLLSTWTRRAAEGAVDADALYAGAQEAMAKGDSAKAMALSQRALAAQSREPGYSLPALAGTLKSITLSKQNRRSELAQQQADQECVCPRYLLDALRCLQMS